MDQVDLPHKTHLGVDLAIVGFAAASLALLMQLGSREWFYLDDWRLSLQARQWSGLVQPYNGHLSIVPVLIYKTLLTWFGFSTYKPLQFVGLGSYVLVAVVLYFTTRRRIGTPAAAAAAMLVLWAPGVHLNVPSLNHYLALIGGIGCAWLLVKPATRSNSWWIFGLLTASLCSADGGLAVGAACIVYAACTRAPWHRWVAGVIPVVAWATWWVVFALPNSSRSAQHRIGMGARMWATIDNFGRSFQSLGDGNKVLGLLIGLAFAARAVHLLRRGPAAAANLLAWSAAFVVWWVGVVWMRGSLAAYGQFRYTFFAMVLLLLAVMPISPIHVKMRWLPESRQVTAAFAIVIVLGPLLAAIQFPHVRANGRYMNVAGDQARVQASQAMVSPKLLTDHHRMGLWFYGVDAGQVRALGHAWGGVPAPDARTEWAALGLVGVQHLGAEPEAAECPGTAETIRLKGGTYLLTPSIDEPVTIDVRVPGMPWQRLERLRAEGLIRMTVPDHLAELPLEISAGQSGVEVSRAGHTTRCMS